MPNTEEPRAASYFLLETPAAQAMFTECNGLTMERQVIETNTAAANGSQHLRKVPGNIKFNNITLKAVCTADMSMWNWFKQVRDGQLEAARFDGKISILDVDHSPMQVYQFKRGWPSKFQGPTINAQSNDVAKEEITLAVEYIERVS